MSYFFQSNNQFLYDFVLDSARNFTVDHLIGIVHQSHSKWQSSISSVIHFASWKDIERGRGRGIKAGPLAIQATKQRLKSDTASQLCFDVFQFLYPFTIGDLLKKKKKEKQGPWSLFRWRWITKVMIEAFTSMNIKYTYVYVIS